MERVNREGTGNLTVGDHRKVIVSFALPLFLSMLFQRLYSTIDALIVGQFLGTEALAAVTSSGSLVFLLVSFFTGMTMGASVVISRYFGAGDMEKVSRAIHTIVVLGFVFGLVLTLVGVFFSPLVLRWMGTDPAVLPESIKYFQTYFSGILTVAMYNVFKSIMNAVGDSKRPLYYLILSSILNVALDVLFVGILGFGVEGAAIATVLAQGVSVLLCIGYLTKPGTVFCIVPKKLRVHLDMLGETVRYGLPGGLQNSVISIANVLVQTNINSFGEIAMAACGSYAMIEGFVFLPTTSLSMSLSTYVGQNLGARAFDRAKRGARFGIGLSMVTSELIGVLVFCFAPIFFRLFTDDPAVIAIGTQQARIEALFYFLLAYSHGVAGVCRGAGKAVVPMLIMFSIWCCVRILYITVAMQICHVIWLLFIAYPLTWAISSVIYCFYYKKGNWTLGFERENTSKAAMARRF